MNEEIQQVKNRSFASVVSLIGQSSYSAIIGFAAFFILTLKSGAYLLGVYGTVLATMSAFTYVTNLGLGAAIMQKKEVDQTDLSSAFYLQFVLTVIAVVIGFIITPQVFSFYRDLPEGAVMLYYSLLFSFFILSLKSIPSVLLEKDLQIYKVVLVQAVENTVFYGAIITLVLMGYELGSLVFAVIARSIIGLILIFVLRPWRPRLLFSWSRSKSLLAYGLPFQGNSFLALIKDDLLIIYLGGAIGLTNLGIVMFGKKYAEFSIRIIMDNLNRVAFPLFARFQQDKVMLQKSLGKVLFFNSLLIFPTIVGGIFIFDAILKIMPGGYFEKWQASLISFYFFSISSLLISQSTPFINLFNAIGKVFLSLGFMVLWTALIWVLVPTLITLMGANGISLAFMIMAMTVIFVVVTAKKYVKFSLYEHIRVSVIASFLMVGCLAPLRFIYMYLYPNPYVFVGLSVTVGVVVYYASVYRFKGREFIDELISLIPRRQGPNNNG